MHHAIIGPPPAGRLRPSRPARRKSCASIGERRPSAGRGGRRAPLAPRLAACPCRVGEIVAAGRATAHRANAIMAKRDLRGEAGGRRRPRLLRVSGLVAARAQEAGLAECVGLTGLVPARRQPILLKISSRDSGFTTLRARTFLAPTCRKSSTTCRLGQETSSLLGAYIIRPHACDGAHDCRALVRPAARAVPEKSAHNARSGMLHCTRLEDFVWHHVAELRAQLRRQTNAYSAFAHDRDCLPHAARGSARASNTRRRAGYVVCAEVTACGHTSRMSGADLS